MGATQSTAPERWPLPEDGRSQKLLLGRAQQEIKSAVHRELLMRIDLEKLSLLQDPRAKQSLQVMIHNLVSQQGIPLSVLERDRLAREVLDELFGLGPLSHYCKTQRSTTYWLIRTTRFTWNEPAFWSGPM
jgi:hypothetical protein